MSVSGEVFVGAYALVDARVVANQLAVMCENQHNYSINKPFPPMCTKCGKPVEVKTISLLRPANLHDLIGEASNVFNEYDKDYGLFDLQNGEFAITSEKTDDTVLFTGCLDGGFAEKLEPKNYQQYIYAFEAKFADELAILREKANSVDVRFGVLVIWS